MKDKLGYLKEPLKLFYLRDKKTWECPYHYHDFDKIMLFLQGHVIYDVEGKSYTLQPYDIVVVRAGQMHRPVIQGDAVYERIIAYISPAYIKAYEKRNCNFATIFQHAPSPILRQPQEVGNMYGVSCRLRQVCSTSASPAKEVLQETLFLEFMIYLAEAVTQHRIGYVKTGEQNEKIRAVLAYIHDHLTADLSIPSLAKQLYVSPDYLMHLFKEETGSSLGNYITAKRLQKASLLMEQHVPLTTICYDSGFKNYSTFYRAWKKYYGTAPKKGGTIDMAPPVE